MGTHGFSLSLQPVHRGAPQGAFFFFWGTAREQETTQLHPRAGCLGLGEAAELPLPPGQKQL